MPGALTPEMLAAQKRRRARHYLHPSGRCPVCLTVWPCDTIQMADHIDAQAAENARLREVLRETNMAYASTRMHRHLDSCSTEDCSYCDVETEVDLLAFFGLPEANAQLAAQPPATLSYRGSTASADQGVVAAQPPAGEQGGAGR